jgi:hypothetical protein
MTQRKGDYCYHVIWAEGKEGSADAPHEIIALDRGALYEGGR